MPKQQQKLNTGILSRAPTDFFNIYITSLDIGQTPRKRRKKETVKKKTRLKRNELLSKQQHLIMVMIAQ